MQITKLSQVESGLVSNVDLTTNDLVTSSIYLGGIAGTQLTNAIAGNLVNLQNGTDFSTGTNSHTHDGRYAKRALDNLSSVAINLSLLPGVTASIDLGSSSLIWLNTHTRSEVLYGLTSGSITLKSADTVASPYSIKFPNAQATTGQVLTASDGSGNMTWATPSGGANTALSNLASTAVNADIIPATDAGVSLGSAAKKYDTVFGYTFRSTLSMTIEAGNDILMATSGAGVNFTGGAPRPLSDLGLTLGTAAQRWSAVHQQTSVLHGSTSGNLQLKAADTTTSYIVKMPGVQATTGQVLTASDGSGNLTWSAPAASGANTALSNLASVAINTGLLFGSGVSGLIRTATGGTTSMQVTTGTVSGSTTGLMSINTGNSSGDATSGQMFISSGDGSGGGNNSSGNAQFTSGDASGTGNSGNTTIRTGLAAGGVRGKIKFVNGSEGTVGHIWTSTATDGSGAWAAAAAAGANTALSNLASTAVNANISPSSTGANLTLGDSTHLWNIVHTQKDNYYDSSNNNYGSIFSTNGTTTPSGATSRFTITSTLTGTTTNNHVAIYTPNIPSGNGNTQNLYLETGNVANSGNSGLINIKTGLGNGGTSGGITLQTGNTDYISGDLIFTSGNSSGPFTTGNMTFVTGAPAAGSGSGAYSFTSGNVTNAAGAASTTGGFTFISGNLTNGSSPNTLTSGNFNATTGNVTGGTGTNRSGSFNLTTGNTSGTGNISGSIVLTTGTATAGTRGQIKFVDGTQGTSGHVWTSTDTLGNGRWQAAASGGNITTYPADTLQTLGATFTVAFNKTYSPLSSAADRTSNATTVVAAGSTAGQLIVLENQGSFILTLKAGGNVKLPQNLDYALGPNGMVELLWNGTFWVTRNASANS